MSQPFPHHRFFEKRLQRPTGTTRFSKKIKIKERDDLPIVGLGNGANLPEAGGVVQGDPQDLDTNFPSTVVPGPYVGEPAVCDRAFPGLGEIAGDYVRRRQGRMGAADRSQFSQTLSEDVVGGVDGREGLPKSRLRRGRKSRRKRNAPRRGNPSVESAQVPRVGTSTAHLHRFEIRCEEGAGDLERRV